MKTVSIFTQSSPELLSQARKLLADHAVELLAEWRHGLPAGDMPSARALFAMENLILPRPLEPVDRGSPAASASWEQIQYTASRLAKLDVPLHAVNDSFLRFQPLAARHLRQHLNGRAEAAIALLEAFHQRIVLAVAEAYAEVQSRSVAALLDVLDAELNSGSLPELLQRLLQQAARVFPIRWGAILLKNEEPGRSPRLLHRALYGVDPSLLVDEAGVGSFFMRVMREGTPGFLLDAANDPRVAQPYYRALDVKSVWAAPLMRPQSGRRAGSRPHGLGVLAVAFDRVYECLPRERELLLALAQRSTMAIERASMAESLGREQRRGLELSRRILDAQDEERRRISRDLHDDTAQSLLVLRLYLEMGLRHQPPAAVRGWIERGLAVVDGSVQGLRRIMAELSPLVLDELGLAAALQLELRRLRALHRWRTRFDCNLAAGRRPASLSRPLETLVYRVVVEGLRNVARHAHATRVGLKIRVHAAEIAIQLDDDGVGLAKSTAAASSGSRFGLTGMRERLRLAGGRMEIDSQPGHGVRLAIVIPLSDAAPETAKPRLVAAQSR